VRTCACRTTKRARRPWVRCCWWLTWHATQSSKASRDCLQANGSQHMQRLLTLTKGACPALPHNHLPPAHGQIE
jgi:hypothetical protein